MGMDLSKLYSYYTHFEIGDLCKMGVVYNQSKMVTEVATKKKFHLL
jgi:hypothetical protein